MDLPFIEHYSSLYRFVCVRLPGDTESARDIVQQIFLDLVEIYRDSQMISKFRGESNPLTWLCSIAKRRIIDQYRKQIRVEHHLYSQRNTASGFLCDKDFVDTRIKSPEDVLMDLETCQIVRLCLAEMPSDQRCVLVLKYLDRYSQKEIARILSRSEKAVESLLGRARATFSQLYNKEVFQ